MRGSEVEWYLPGIRIRPGYRDSIRTPCTWAREFFSASNQCRTSETSYQTWNHFLQPPSQKNISSSIYDRVKVALSRNNAHLHRLHIRTEVHCRRQSEQLLGKKPRCCLLVHVAQTNRLTPLCRLFLQVFESLNLEDHQTEKVRNISKNSPNMFTSRLSDELIGVLNACGLKLGGQSKGIEIESDNGGLNGDLFGGDDVAG